MFETVGYSHKNQSRLVIVSVNSGQFVAYELKLLSM